MNDTQAILNMRALSVICPLKVCASGRGLPCVTASGTDRAIPHARRMALGNHIESRVQDSITRAAELRVRWDRIEATSRQLQFDLAELRQLTLL
jgi:hypothetical protein